jgi:hypothetical protein
VRKGKRNMDAKTGGKERPDLDDLVKVTVDLEDTRDFGRYNKGDERPC